MKTMPDDILDNFILTTYVLFHFMQCKMYNQKILVSKGIFLSWTFSLNDVHCTFVGNKEVKLTALSKCVSDQLVPARHRHNRH